MTTRTTILLAVTAIAIACLSYATACTPSPSPAPLPDVYDEADGATSATCANVCRHELALGCTAARPTAKGAPCVEVCENRLAAGIPGAKPDLRCKMRATSCAVVDACDR